jgi:ATP-binding cassette subfamily B protein
MRLYAPPAGKITFDGTDAQSLPLAWLRRQIGIVPQDCILFGGSIADNIAYGRPGASMDDIREAARQANADEFINAFPKGYDTLVGDRGAQLSGGQRQRIAIARAILKNPAILILDEATSSLDSQSEQLIQTALDRLMLNRTTFVIAHRLATIRHADLIAVLVDGEIVERGTHDSLIADHDGVYHQLCRLQFHQGTTTPPAGL